MKANKEKQPLISIIIPCYNQGIYLMDAVNSAISQTYKNTEIVIINDGSTDKYTNNLFKKLNRERKIKIINQKNKGVSEARNVAIKNATGEYILPLDADNKLDPNFLLKTYKHLSESKIGVVYTWMKYFGEKEGVRKFIEYDFERLLLSNYIDTGSLFRKKDWEAAGGFKKMKYSGVEDWDFFISISELGYEGVCIKEPLLYYRSRRDSMITGLVNDIENYCVAATEVYNNHMDSYNKYGYSVFLEHTRNIIHINSIRKNHNHELNQKNNIIEEKNTELKQNYSTIKEKDKEIIQYNKTINQKNQYIHNISNELTDLKNSYSWKLTSPFRKIKWALCNPRGFITKYKYKLKSN